MSSSQIFTVYLLFGGSAAVTQAKVRVSDSAVAVPPAQVPPVFEALTVLQNNKTADGNYPQYAEIPDPKSFTCIQPGYYADVEFQCQVYRRCDLNGTLTSYLCPNQSLFNQITLICDWYYNVDCSLSSRFDDYSNARLYHENWPLFTDADDSTPHPIQTPVIGRPGTCPPNPPGSFGVCVITCQSDSVCADDKKCCPTVCGGRICKDPVFY